MIKFKTLLISSFICLPNIIWADGNIFLRTISEPTKEDLSDVCRKQGTRLGDGKTLGFIKDPCLDEVVNFSPLRNRDALDDGDIKVFGLGNVIYYEVTQDEVVFPKMLAGDQTKLEMIESLRVHPERKEIFVLDIKQGLMAAHAIKYSGNVAPLRFFYDERLKTAQSFSFSEDKKRILVYSKEAKKFFDYPIELNDQGRRPSAADKEQFLLFVDDVGGHEINDFWEYENKIYALDSQASSLLIFEKNDKGKYRVVSTTNLPRFSEDSNFNRMLPEILESKKNLVFFDDRAQELEITLP